MATFTVDTKALHKIQEKFKQTAELYKAYAVQELNKSVKAMEMEATTKAGNLPRITSTAKKPYKRTGNLSRSVSSRPYQNGYASFSMGNATVKYAPYVEFGTGKFPELAEALAFSQSRVFRVEILARTAFLSAGSRTVGGFHHRVGLVLGVRFLVRHGFRQGCSVLPRISI